MKYCLSLLLLCLAACSVERVIPLDSHLSPSATQILSDEGLSLGEERNGKDLEPHLTKFLRSDGKVRIAGGTGCGDLAHSLGFLLTLGILPGWCPATVSIEYHGSHCINARVYKKYSEEYVGWLMPLFVPLPSWQMVPADKDPRLLRQQGYITLINRLAEGVCSSPDSPS